MMIDLLAHVLRRGTEVGEHFEKTPPFQYLNGKGDGGEVKAYPDLRQQVSYDTAGQRVHVHCNHNTPTFQTDPYSFNFQNNHS